MNSKNASICSPAYRSMSSCLRSMTPSDPCLFLASFVFSMPVSLYLLMHVEIGPYHIFSMRVIIDSLASSSMLKTL